MNSLYFYQFYFETKNIDTLNTKKKMYNINNFFNGNRFFSVELYDIRNNTILFCKRKERKNNQTEVTLVYALHSKL